MSRLVENKSVFAMVFVVFALVGAANAIQGAGVAVPSYMPLAEPANAAHGATMPPDPWDGNVTVANGPILDPYPWDGNFSVTA